MKTKRATPRNIDEYIAGYPGDVQQRLEKIRETIRKAMPRAEETISYQIPCFTLNGKYVIYFAAFKNHISVYPAPRGYDEFKKELASYEGGKGTVQFPLDKPVPFGLITRIVKFRIAQSRQKEKAKAKKKS
jgi:uncharacterized protein YdhG (YjbR/CyaY superfamily)